MPSETKRDFGENQDEYIFVKSHFEDEERLRGRKDKERRRIGRIHLCEVSLRGRRETSGKERERRRETSEKFIRGKRDLKVS